LAAAQPTDQASANTHTLQSPNRLGFVEIIGLQTPRGRLTCFAAITAAIYVMPFSLLKHLSLWQLLHVNSPSIGLTRAYWLIMHGSPVAAWHTNELIYLVLPVVLAISITDILRIRKTS